MMEAPVMWHVKVFALLLLNLHTMSFIYQSGSMKHPRYFQVLCHTPKVRKYSMSSLRIYVASQGC